MSPEFHSDYSGLAFPRAEKVMVAHLRPTLLQEILKEKPDFPKDGAISLSELNHFRNQYIQNILIQELGTISHLEEQVLKSIEEKSLISNQDTEDPGPLTLGQRLADKIASFGGSWAFILSFGGFLGLWILTNLIVLGSGAFDPFPFILLNLILSCIAALQAPIIMMSQNRQEEKDRQRSRYDYQINLKAELEVRLLHEKMDHLIMNQQQKLLDIQAMQIEMMEDIMKKLDRGGGGE